MGSSSSIPYNSPTDYAAVVSDEQTLRHLEDGVRFVGLLTPPKNKFFRTLHCHFRGEEFDSIVKVCFVKDVDLSHYHQRLKIQKQVLTKQNAPNVLTNHRFRYGATRTQSSLAGATGNAALPVGTGNDGVDYAAQNSDLLAQDPSSSSASPTFLVRQYLFANLKDRLATRPFLSEFEKLWIAYSLLNAVQQLHLCGICHGEIKTENVLLTSWGWVVLTDMAPYKPTFLEPDQAAAPFNFFFSTGKKRCYLAPERFVKSTIPAASSSTSSPPLNNKQDNSSTPRKRSVEVEGDDLDPSMDLFAVGMVLIELFNVDGSSGESTFELSDALEYSARGTSARLEELLNKVSNKEIRQMCNSLTKRNPADRMPIADCLALFPSSFAGFLYPFMHSMLDNTSNNAEYSNQEEVLVWKTCEAYKDILTHLGLFDERGAKMCSTLLKTKHAFFPQRADAAAAAAAAAESTASPHPEEEEEFRKVKEIIYKMERTLQGSGTVATAVTVHINEEEDDVTAAATNKLPADNILVVLLSFLGVCVLKAKQESTRAAAMLLLKQFALLTRSDDFTLARVIPFIVHRLSKDNEPSVLCRCLAIETLVELLDSLESSSVPVAEQKYFPDYLFPLLEKCSRDPAESVRVSFASNLAAIASHAKFFLESSRQQLPVGDAMQAPTITNYDADLSILRDFVQRMMEKLTAENGNVVVDFAIKNALVKNMLKLCLFFGRDRIETWLLPWLLSIFNIWQLQVSGLNSLASVSAFVGTDAFHMFLFPLLDDMLCSNQDLVVEAAMSCLSTLVTNQLITPKAKLFKLTESIAPLLRHPSVRVRRACLRVLASIFCIVDHVDVQLFLIEHIQVYFHAPTTTTHPDVFLLFGRQGMTWKQTLTLLDSLRLLPPATTTKQWAKDFNRPLNAISSQQQQGTQKTALFSRFGCSNVEQQYPLHSILVDESLAGRGGRETMPPLVAAASLHAKYGLVEGRMPPAVSSESLVYRVRALGLPELKFNLNRQGILEEPPSAAQQQQRKEWRIRGNLVTPLLEHTGPVQRIQVSEDSSYFTTGSDDGTVKLWVCAKLDRNPCPKSRITFNIPGGRVVDLCSIKHTSSFAVGSADGQISLVRTDGPTEAFKHASINPSNLLESKLVALAAPDCNDLFAATERGHLYHWDLRSGQKLLEDLVLTPGLGSVSCMATSLDRTWLVLGTHRGVIAVFDLRFNLLLAAWRHPNSNPIYRLHVSKSTEGKPLVFVCTGRNQAMLLNIETGETKLAFACALPEVSADLDTQASFRQAQEKLFTQRFDRVELDSRRSLDRYVREAQMSYSVAPQHYSMRAILVPGDVMLGEARRGGDHVSVLTAGTDMTVRYWDCQNASASSLVTAPMDEQKPRWEAKRLPAPSGGGTLLLSFSGQKIIQQNKTTLRFVVRTSHSDAILDLGALRMRDSRYLLVTAGRDGAVKLWQ